MPSNENHEFDFFTTFLRHTNEKNVAANIVSHLLEILLKDTIYKDTSLKKFLIYDPGCGDGSFSKEIIQSLAQYGLIITYEGTDQSSNARSIAEDSIESLPDISECRVNEEDINESKRIDHKTDLILLSHAAYYIKDLDEWIKSKAESLTTNGIMLSLHAPSFSVHHQIRQTVQNKKKISPVDEITHIINSQSKYEVISVPFSSFVYFNSDLEQLKKKYETNDNTRSTLELEDEKLLKFIAFGDSKINDALPEQLMKAIEMIQESFLSSRHELIIWDVIQLIAPRNSNFFYDRHKSVLPELLETSPYISPLHFAAIEGKFETYKIVQEMIMQIYGRAGKSFPINPYKLGVATPLYMSLIGYKGSVTEQSRTKHFALVRELRKITDIDNDVEKRSKIFALRSNDPEIYNLFTINEQETARETQYIFESITKDLASFTSNNVLDKKLSEYNKLFLELYLELFNDYFKLDDEGLKQTILSSIHFNEICTYLNGFAANLLYHKHDGVQAKKILAFNLNIIQKIRS